MRFLRDYITIEEWSLYGDRSFFVVEMSFDLRYKKVYGVVLMKRKAVLCIVLIVFLAVSTVLSEPVTSPVEFIRASKAELSSLGVTVF